MFLMGLGNLRTSALKSMAVFACIIMTTSHSDAEVLPSSVSPIFDVACTAPFEDPQRFRNALPNAHIVEHLVTDIGNQPGRAKTVLSLNGLNTEIQALFPGDLLRRVTVEVSDSKPRSSISVDSTCQFTEAREIVYDTEDRIQSIRVYASDLKTVTSVIALNPDIPMRKDPGGISVGLIDSGVNYTLEAFNKNLARDTYGHLIGRDLWDGDNKPFDADLGRSDFFPLHHGSAVMSVLTNEAPMARVIPVRYPRPDMTKMADAIEWLAGHNVRIVNLTMGSNSQKEWQAFQETAEKYPRILFIVSAGNDGRDIDQRPIYPASLTLPNTIVVTSSSLDGRLAQGSNWGVEHVDIMVPGERVEVIDHRGASGKASGSSFAAPRVTALAVRVLAKNTDWHGPEIRDWILKRARPTSGRAITRYGWIPDPSDGP